MTIEARIQTPGPKRMLALDGGGIRGVITVEVFGAIEELLRKKLNKGSEFVLSDYFDFVASTSTGATRACSCCFCRIALSFSIRPLLTQSTYV